MCVWEKVHGKGGREQWRGWWVRKEGERERESMHKGTQTVYLVKLTLMK